MCDIKIIHVSAHANIEANYINELKITKSLPLRLQYIIDKNRNKPLSYVTSIVSFPFGYK